MHYVDEGAGQPILMCHGNPTWSFLFRHVIKSLRDRFRCIAVDYPGFGLSARPHDYGYTPAEHAAVVDALVRELDLSQMIVMGHDWGGPIGTSVACSDPARVSGLVLGNTWFWPVDRRARVFSRVMTTGPVQRAILHRNLFVERILPRGIARRLAPEEMEHYRRAQPTPDARRGVAEFPRQLVAATPMLAELEPRVTRDLGDKRVLITFPMRDVAVRARPAIPRMERAFSDVEVVRLPRAKHYFLEDAPDEVSEAIKARFGQARSTH
jgi:haloalkane dehalogenase